MGELFQTMKAGEDAGFVGLTPLRKAAERDPALRAKLAEAYRLVKNADGMSARQHAARMEEAIVRTDFPQLFGVILEHELTARYKAATMDFWPFTRRLRATSTNLHTIHRLDGLTEPLEEIDEDGEYQTSVMKDAQVTWKVTKKGRVVELTWESLIDDAMGALQDLPARLADAAINTDQYLATKLYAAAAGPNPSLFSGTLTTPDGATIDNLGAESAGLAGISTIAGLMAKQTDPVTGLRMRIRGVHIVCPMALEETFREALTSALKMTVVTTGGTLGTPVVAGYPTTSILPQMGYQLHVNPWLDYITTSPDKTWYMFADLGQGAAIGYGYLVGYETPEICMRASNKVALGGEGLLGALTGSFEADDAAYRVRVVNGGCSPIEPRFAYASVGA